MTLADIIENPSATTLSVGAGRLLEDGIRPLLGMTGTRNPLSIKQLDWLDVVIAGCQELHHGACINADEAAHDAGVKLGRIVWVHPPTDQRLMMPTSKWRVPGVRVMPPRPYLERNRNIVDDTDALIAVPEGPERQTGGTWYTVRYALSVGRVVTICYPDGRVEVRYPRESEGENAAKWDRLP